MTSTFHDAGWIQEGTEKYTWCKHNFHINLQQHELGHIEKSAAAGLVPLLANVTHAMCTSPATCEYNARIVCTLAQGKDAHVYSWLFRTCISGEGFRTAPCTHDGWSHRYHATDVLISMGSYSYFHSSIQEVLDFYSIQYEICPHSCTIVQLYVGNCFSNSINTLAGMLSGSSQIFSAGV